MDKQIDSPVSQATRPVLDKLDAVQAALLAKMDELSLITFTKFDAFAQIKLSDELRIEKRWVAIRWSVGTAVATVATTLGIFKAIGHL